MVRAPPTTRRPMHKPLRSRTPAEATAEAPTWCWWQFGTICSAGLLAWTALIGWTLVDASWPEIDAALTFVSMLLTYVVLVAACVSCSLWALLLLPARRAPRRFLQRAPTHCS